MTHSITSNETTKSPIVGVQSVIDVFDAPNNRFEVVLEVGGGGHNDFEPGQRMSLVIDKKDALDIIEGIFEFLADSE